MQMEQMNSAYFYYLFRIFALHNRKRHHLRNAK